MCFCGGGILFVALMCGDSLLRQSDIEYVFVRSQMGCAINCEIFLKIIDLFHLNW